MNIIEKVPTFLSTPDAVVPFSPSLGGANDGDNPSISVPSALPSDSGGAFRKPTTSAPTPGMPGA